MKKIMMEIFIDVSMVSLILVIAGLILSVPIILFFAPCNSLGWVPLQGLPARCSNILNENK